MQVLVLPQPAVPSWRCRRTCLVEGLVRGRPFRDTTQTTAGAASRSSRQHLCCDLRSPLPRQLRATIHLSHTPKPIIGRLVLYIGCLMGFLLDHRTLTCDTDMVIWEEDHVVDRQFRGATWRITGVPLRGSRRKVCPDPWLSMTRRLQRVLCVLYTPTLSFGKARTLCLLGDWVPSPSSSLVLCREKRVWQNILQWKFSRHRGPLRRHCVVPDSNIT